MNLRSNRISLRLATWLTLVACSPLPAEINLHPIFSNDMVLQQGEDNVIFGLARKGAKVTGFFRGEKFGSVKSSGEWELRLSKSHLKDVSPTTLEFVEETAGQQSRKVLTNVVVGRVWWVGTDVPGAMSATALAISAIGSESARERIRFVNLERGAWVSLARQDATTHRIDAFALVAAHNLATNDYGYVGIIQTFPDTIHRYGADDPPGRDPAKVRTQVSRWLLEAQDRVNRDYVSILRTQTQQLLIDDKHRGVVTSRSLPNYYTIATVRLRDDFSPATPDLKKLFRRYNFEGAIW